MMETDTSLADKNENGRVSWINHRFFRAFVAGVIVGSGLLLAIEFKENFMIQQEPTLAELIFDIGIPVLGVYLVAKWVQFFLSRYGFEGFSTKRNEGMTIAQLAIAFIGFVLGPMILLQIFSFTTELSEKIGEDGMGALVGFVMIGALAFIVLRRRAQVQDRKYWTNLLLLALILLVPVFLYLIFFFLSYRSF